MKVVIIDYGAGNIQSIQFAFQRLGIQAVLTNNRQEIITADRVIFPGVGEASYAMKKLKTSGLDRVIPTLTQPVLGICLGMQLMCAGSEEGQTEGLGIFNCKAVKFKQGLNVPQIGWNQVEDLNSDLFIGVEEGAFMYLVHSYYVPIVDQTISKTTYGVTYSSAMQRENFYGVQFHPEKSSKAGAQILQNFLNLTHE